MPSPPGRGGRPSGAWLGRNAVIGSNSLPSSKISRSTLSGCTVIRTRNSCCLPSSQEYLITLLTTSSRATCNCVRARTGMPNSRTRLSSVSRTRPMSEISLWIRTSTAWIMASHDRTLGGRPGRPPPQRQRRQIVCPWSPPRESIDGVLDNANHLPRLSRIGLPQELPHALDGEQVSFAVYRFEYAVRAHKQRIARKNLKRPRLEPGLAPDAQRQRRLRVDLLRIAGARNQMGPRMAGIHERYDTAAGVDQAQKHRYEHAIVVVLAQLAVDCLQQRSRIDVVGAPFQPEIDGDAHETAGARHEHCRRSALAANVADQEAERVLAGIEAVVQISADFSCRLHDSVNGDRMRRRAGRELSRQHGKLQRARGRQFLYQPFHVPANLVPQALLLERCADPCAKQRRIERLAEVILSAELDAADDALDFVEGRDHYYGNVAQRRRGLHLFEDLIAVHIGHHDVQQDEMERLCLQLVQGLSPVLRHCEVLVAFTVEAARQRISVVLIVVDDQQSGVGGGHDTRPFPTSAWIFSIKRAISTGLVSNSSQPAASASSRSPVMAWAVSAMTGICRVSSPALMRRVASQPSSTGKLRSIRMTSGCSVAAMDTPWAPSDAVKTG